MKVKSPQHYEARAAIAKALGHPTRMLLLDVLNRREMCVGDLTDLAQVDQSTVSRHLAVLKAVGIVEDEKRGSMVYYRLRLKCVLRFFDCVESVMKCNAENQQRLLS